MVVKKKKEDGVFKKKVKEEGCIGDEVDTVLT
jgi:hypothetical protein